MSHVMGCKGAPCVCSQPRIDNERLKHLINYHRVENIACSSEVSEAETNLALDLSDARLVLKLVNDYYAPWEMPVAMRKMIEAALR